MQTAAQGRIIVSIMTRAFAGERQRMQRACLASDGGILVYDSVAGYFTRCHSLTLSAQRAIRRRIAAAEKEDHA